MGNGAWWRFVLFGGLNTALTYGLFIALGLLLPASVSYAIAFALGLLIVATASNRLIYRGDRSAIKKALYVGWYLVIFGVGQTVIWVVDPVGLSQLIVTAGIIFLFTAPMTFFGGRIIFGSSRDLPRQDKPWSGASAAGLGSREEGS